MIYTKFQICQVLSKIKKILVFITPKGIRIPVCSVKGSCPRPLDDGGKTHNKKYILAHVLLSGQRDSNARLQPWQGCALPLSYARYYMEENIFLYDLFYKINLKMSIV